MSEFEPDGEEYISFSKAETHRMTALAQAVKSRVPNANADEIVREAQVFEKYLTGNIDE